jgi:hypothetical protein
MFSTHHDRIVDDEAGGDGQRHQRQIVERKTGDPHHRERRDQRHGYGHGRDQRRAQVTQEQEDHGHDQKDGQNQRHLYFFDRGTHGLGAIAQDVERDPLRQRSPHFGQERLDAFCDFDHVGARLTLHVQDDRARRVRPTRELVVLHPVDDVGDLTQPQRGAVFVREQKRLEVRGLLELIVGVKRVLLVRSVQRAGRLIDVRRDDGRAHVFQCESSARERDRIDLHAHGGTLAPVHAHEPDTRHL